MRRKLAVLAVFLLLLALIAYLTRRYHLVDEVVAHELQLRQWIKAHPWKSFAYGWAIYFLVSLVPGTSGKSIIAGWLFGFWRGVLIVQTALAAAAMVMSVLSRFVLQEAIQSRFAVRLQRLNAALERDGPFYLLTLRMLHMPYTFVNYLSGASTLPAWTFLWTTALGMLPSTMVFVYVGTQLPTLHTLMTHGPERLLDPSLLGALLLMGLFPFVTRSIYRQVRSATDRETAEASSSPDH